MIPSALEWIDAFQEANKARTKEEKEAAAVRLVKAELTHYEKLGLERRPGNVFIRTVVPVLLVAMVCVTLILVVSFSYKANETANEAKAATAQVHRLALADGKLVTNLHAALVEACRQTGNARAEVQREQLHEEIEEAEHPDPQAFQALVEAGVRPEAIEEAEAKAVVKYKRRLHRVHLVDCADQYDLTSP